MNVNHENPKNIGRSGLQTQARRLELNPRSRRGFLRSGLAAATAAAFSHTWSSSVRGTEADPPSLAGEIGITTGGLDFQREQNILTALTLPRFVCDQLGMRLIDLNTRWLISYDDAYLQKVVKAASDADCFFSNLKVNHKFGDLNSRDPQERRKSMDHAKRMIETAKTLGARWVRFPIRSSSDKDEKLDPYRELARYSQQNEIQLLVENSGWMKSDPNSVARLVKLIANNAAPAPDTGNWDDDVRYAGLAKSFPNAVTCDFKVFDLDKENRHELYDIKRCFDIAWKSGFRGPWAIEHWNDDISAFARETTFLRDQLKRWIADAE